MKITTENVDLVKTRQHWPPGQPFQPRLIKTRKELGNLNWTVLSAQYINGNAPEWSYTDHDSYVGIPLFEYDLPVQFNLALASFLPLGIACAGSLKKSIRRVHIVTGVPVEVLFDADKNEDVGIRYWFGLAVVTE